MLRRAFTLLAVNVVVFCVLAEVASLIVYYVETDRLFYVQRRQYALIPETTEGRLTADGLNPYFGPSHTPGHPFEIPPELRDAGAEAPRLATNNFGFVSPYNFPIDRTRNDQFIIGVFGGSVGVWFCQVGASRLLADLQQHDFFKTRRLVPLCMAHEGYKQPQQALVLAYFLSIGQPFDLVINIDGFNEVALSRFNNDRRLDISMPSVVHLEPLINLTDASTLTPEKLQSLAAIGQAKARHNQLTSWLQRNRIAAIDFVLHRYRSIVLTRYNRELRTFGELPSNPSRNSVITAIPPTEDRQGAMLYEDIARNWARASMLMQEMLAARSVPYLHFLQPNQYWTTRPFSGDEARVAIDPASPYKTSVEQGYPALLAEARSGRLKQEAAFFDATGIFDAERAPVYIDNCCHYTLTGYRTLADFIASAVVKSPGPWTGSRPRSLN